mmetsp:Transcript_44277/g.102309  ORF Transcript_44277/g.102309 Transcript_44277/m.102309 type:complete len:321 (-) Transcript_44277:630-1592(-)
MHQRALHLLARVCVHHGEGVHRRDDRLELGLILRDGQDAHVLQLAAQREPEEELEHGVEPVEQRGAPQHQQPFGAPHQHGRVREVLRGRHGAQPVQPCARRAAVPACVPRSPRSERAPLGRRRVEAGVHDVVVDGTRGQHARQRGRGREGGDGRRQGGRGRLGGGGRVVPSAAAPPPRLRARAAAHLRLVGRRGCRRLAARRLPARRLLFLRVVRRGRRQRLFPQVPGRRQATRPARRRRCHPLHGRRGGERLLRGEEARHRARGKVGVGGRARARQRRVKALVEGARAQRDVEGERARHGLHPARHLDGRLERARAQSA